MKCEKHEEILYFMHSFSKQLDWWGFETLGSNFGLSLLYRRTGPTKYCLKWIILWKRRCLTHFLSKWTLSQRVTVVSYSPSPLMNHNLPYTSTTSFSPITAGNRTYVLLLLFQQQAQLSAVITLSHHSQIRENPRPNSCFTSLIPEFLTDTHEPGSSTTAGTVPSAGTAPPHPRHIPGKAAASSLLNQSPLHPKSERTDSNFPNKVTVRMHLFSRCWHSTLYFIKVWSLCLPAVGHICIRLCKPTNGHNLLQTGISSMAITIDGHIWHTVALDAPGSGFFLLTWEFLLRFLTSCSL